MNSTRLDPLIHEFPISLPLYAHPAWVIPVARMDLLDFVKRAEAEACRCLCDVFAERPPDGFGTRDSS